LDVLRFFAAFCVLVYHLGFFGWASRWGTTPEMLQGAARYEVLAPFAWFGWVGVQMFFVISGFVIANSAYGRAPVDFLKGRLLRLFPAAWICATISLLAWIVLGGVPLAALVGEYARAMSLWLVGPWIDGVYWSLAVEIVFYALVLCVLIGRRFLALSSLPWVLTFMSAVYIAIVYTPGAAAALEAQPVLGALMRHADILLAKYGCFFAAGIWLWLMSRNEMTPLRYAGLAVAVICGMAQIAQHATEASQGDLTIEMAMPVWAPISAWLAALALIVAVARAPHWFRVRSPKRQAVLKRIGLMTYPLFLTHNVVGAGVIREATSRGVDQWAALLLAVVIVIGLAYLICATAEVELRKHMRTFLDGADDLLRKTVLRLRPQGAADR
jgi:peptidoglycan/LPS O-acetylase OafA/YrhL